MGKESEKEWIYVCVSLNHYAVPPETNTSGLTASEGEWHVGYFVTKLDGKALCVLYKTL